MQLGFFSAILPDQSFSQVMEFAAGNGFACVEIGCWPVARADRKFAGIMHIDVEQLSAAKIDELTAACDKHSVSISALGYYPNALDPDPAVSGPAVEHLKKVIRAANALGVGRVNTFVGRDPGKTVDENWPRFLATWKPLIALAEEQNVRVGIENCPMSFTRDEWPGGKNLASSPSVWRRMFSEIPSQHFGLNYDPSHFVLQRMDPLSPLKEFRHKLFHVHAKDMMIRQDQLNEVGSFAFPNLWHTPRIPGFGDINWSRFIAALHEVGYDGPVCIEVEDDTFGKSLSGRWRALKIARQTLAPYFAEAH